MSPRVVPNVSPNPSVAQTMNVRTETLPLADSLNACTIVVLYDDDSTRDRAMDACDYLVNQFWKDVELKIHWWRLDFLNDAALAGIAASNAIKSDFLIICLQPHEVISPSLESWFEIWLPHRGEKDGALVNLLGNGEKENSSPQIEQFLKYVCRRGNFDYLTSIPFETRPGGDGASGQVAGKTIWRESRPPSHFGLNE